MVRDGQRIPNDVIRDAHQRYLVVGSLRKVGEEYGITAATLSRRFKDMGLKMSGPGRKKGTKAPRRTYHGSSKVDGWLVHLSGGEYDGHKVPVPKLGKELSIYTEGGEDVYEYISADEATKVAVARLKEKDE